MASEAYEITRAFAPTVRSQDGGALVRWDYGGVAARQGLDVPPWSSGLRDRLLAETDCAYLDGVVCDAWVEVALARGADLSSLTPVVVDAASTFGPDAGVADGTVLPVGWWYLAPEPFDGTTLIDVGQGASVSLTAALLARGAARDWEIDGLVAGSGVGCGAEYFDDGRRVTCLPALWPSTVRLSAAPTELWRISEVGWEDHYRIALEPSGTADRWAGTVVEGQTPGDWVWCGNGDKVIVGERVRRALEASGASGFELRPISLTDADGDALSYGTPLGPDAHEGHGWEKGDDDAPAYVLDIAGLLEPRWEHATQITYLGQPTSEVIRSSVTTDADVARCPDTGEVFVTAAVVQALVAEGVFAGAGGGLNALGSWNTTRAVPAAEARIRRTAPQLGAAGMTPPEYLWLREPVEQRPATKT